MENKMFDKFKIKIHTNKVVPIVQDNPILSYIYDKEIDELFVKLFYDGTKIAEGVILDFYKQFTNIETNGEIQTQIKTFPFHDITKQKYTNLGNKIYQLKYLKNPPIPKTQRACYISEFTDAINHYVPSLKEINANLKISYIPSSTKTPDDISLALSELSSLELANMITKNTKSIVDSKNITDFNVSMQYAQSKYILDKAYIEANMESNFIILDDVMGSGSSILTVMKKLHDLNHKTNYFFIVVKDVKR